MNSINSKNIGIVLKKLREIKSKSQEDVASANLTRSTISRIENNKLNPSFDSVITYLENINVTLSDFIQFSSTIFMDEKDEIIAEMRNLKHSVYEDPINHLINRINEFLKHTEDYQLTEYRAALLALIEISREHSYLAGKKYVEFIWDRLKKQDEFLPSDIYILSYTFYTFEPETAINIINRLEKYIQKYTHISDLKRTHAAIFINMISYLKENNLIEKTGTYIETALTLSKNLQDHILVYQCYYRKAEYLYFKGKRNEAIRLRDKSFAYFKFTENEIMYNDFVKQWELFLEKYNLQ
ncbi:helix-turn-helix transcriptional regulator [Listeria weihenstephanensis]|uniref:Helix-turn-helix transcriptional regulator n=1 Tax=Listeria weihenstephanensis TaxID=1006155 RepID=A0A841Z418_9LIST|nr:helix-turn-helix transcriptional regulator [Listeria weihenstephanensis]MBC1500024.1 helix-turn-helix transcriptional regulator [Listeria weihenstephanensis]